MFLQRTIYSDQGTRSSMALEPPFWRALDHIAAERDEHWLDWVERELEGRPEHINKSSWIRSCVTECLLIDYQLR